MTLRITVEIVPEGDESRRRVLDVADVSSPGEIGADGKYTVQLERSDPFTLYGHDRNEGYWELVRRVAEAAKRL